jgi:gamma-glutamylcyclotransferase (GGCT)/AIG2-like uncharacterized protein YtfP
MQLFVYGTLMPGHLRWPVVRDQVVDHRPTTVAGALYDTGWGYPAARFDEAGSVPGWLLRFDDEHETRVFAVLDLVEGDHYRRVTVQCDDGTAAFSYEWIGPRTGLIPADVGWDRQLER